MNKAEVCPVFSDAGKDKDGAVVFEYVGDRHNHVPPGEVAIFPFLLYQDSEYLEEECE